MIVCYRLEKWSTSNFSQFAYRAIGFMLLTEIPYFDCETLERWLFSRILSDRDEFKVVNRFHLLNIVFIRLVIGNRTSCRPIPNSMMTDQRSQSRRSKIPI